MSTKNPSSGKDTPEDFWDLGDDELDLHLPTQEAEKAPTSKETPQKEEKKTTSKEAPPKKKKASNSKHTPTKEEKTSAEKEPKLTSKDQNSEVTPEAQEPNTTTPSIENKKPTEPRPKWFTGLSLAEKSSLLILIACLAGAAVWGLSSYHKEAPQGPLITFDEEFPVKGSHITVAEVATGWRQPIRSGENVDRGVLIEANLIPCARIKLQDSGTTTLQVTFRNGKRDLVGDPITLNVNDGKFTQTGSDEITINSTSGLASTSELNAYTNGDIDPWSIVIEESDDSSSGEEPFLKVRIEPSYKED